MVVVVRFAAVLVGFAVMRAGVFEVEGRGVLVNDGLTSVHHSLMVGRQVHRG